MLLTATVIVKSGQFVLLYCWLLYEWLEGRIMFIQPSHALVEDQD